MQKHLWKVGGIGIRKLKRAGWRDLQEKMDGKAGSENPIVDPLLSFIRKTKNAQLKNPTDLLHKNVMKPLG